jgi:nucleotide-binding universal stress UspA family protein
MFKNMLLRLDGSQFSELALPLATQIAKAAGAKLHIVRVHVPTVAQAKVPAQRDVDELVHDKEREHMGDAVARARAGGIAAESELLEGPVVRALERYIEARAIDLVVMTTHGRSGLSRAVLGSVAERCVRTTHVPVLLLHPRAADDTLPDRPDALKRILVALDGSPESEEVLAPVIDVARLTGARITLARVATAPFDIVATLGVEALQEYLQRARAQALKYLDTVLKRIPGDVQANTLSVAADRAAIGILRCQEESGADLIAMATSGRSGWARIAIGSVAESVLHKATVPVLMLRPAAFTGRAGEEESAALIASTNQAYSRSDNG